VIALNQIQTSPSIQPAEEAKLTNKRKKRVFISLQPFAFPNNPHRWNIQQIKQHIININSN
jgi:hypothetical protein